MYKNFNTIDMYLYVGPSVRDVAKLMRILVGVKIYKIFGKVSNVVRQQHFQEAHLLFQTRVPTKIRHPKAGIR